MGSSEVIPQAGAIPYRRLDGGGLEVCLVTASNGGWTIPKGMIDPGHTARQMAEIEALEEAGVIGSAEEESVGFFNYEKFDRVYRVEVFAMPVDRVLDTWAEDDERERAWFPASDAANSARLPQMGDVIRLFIERESERPA